MMGIRAIIERVRGATSGRGIGERGRRILGIVVVIVLIGFSGYLAAANGVSVDFSFDDDPVETASAESRTGATAGPDAGANAAGGAATESAVMDYPEGFVGPGSPVTKPDRDGDGIADSAEREIYGTDPSARDTDGDGIPDGMELVCSDAYPDADPLRQDVYVELDSVDGAGLDEDTITQIRTAFADAPVANPSGEDGIALHLVTSDRDLPEGDSVNDDRRPGAYNDIEDYRDEHFQHEAAGYYYALVSTNVAYNGDDYYAGAGQPGTAVVEHYDRDGVMSSLVVHELGHAFGLGRSQEGVDTRTYARGEYDSVMNYNALYETTAYSDGSDDVGRDEWSYVAQDRHRPAIQTDGGEFCPTVD